ncbi:hypothetical protein B0H17DRAFT_1004545 [Mycena rosella]|uniref:Uncharacterized protein n=1 Tax=Mycena rosella TaxID=1033263 RepID=A0AAD7DZG9_MYCRO|nr:hypothetical protein B0H17DRAFT_1004545 [Mycena rosella]
MRFFKFLHRRSKSDSAIPTPTPARDHILKRPQSLDAAHAAVFAAAVPTCPQTFLFPTPADASNAIFELETANSRLRSDVSAWAADCADLRSQLDATRADLFTHLHRISSLERQGQADKLEIEKLHAQLAQYERFLSLMINVGLHQRVLGDAHAALRAGIDPDMALVNAIKEAAATPGSAWSTIIPSVTGPRTPDEYRSSLNMTLKARKELRDTKKVAKFWKRVAKEEGGVETVTPSVSTISSIHEPLSAERQKAVEQLISSRRHASLISQDAESEPPLVPVSASTSSTSTSSTSTDITPSNSGSEIPCLSPLASASFKSELASISSKPRLFKRGVASRNNRPVLGQIDMNASQNCSQQRTKTSKPRVDSRAENAPPVQTAAALPEVRPPRLRELTVANVVPSFSKHSLCTSQLGPLGRIEEEREDFLSTDPPEEANTSQDSANWCMLDFPNHDSDLSFSFCDTAISTPPTTPEKAVDETEISPTKTSRLPKPVLKQLNRISLTKPGKRTEAPQITPLAVRKRSTGRPSSTRLPVFVQGKRNIVRA